MNRLGQLGRMSWLNGNVSVRKRILPETKAYIAAMTVRPTSAIANVYNTLIKSMISSGIWDKLACLELYYTAHTEQAGLLNVVNPAETGRAVNTPTWEQIKGYTTNGSTNYVDTGFQPTDDGMKYKRNNAIIGWVAHWDSIPQTNGWYDVGWSTGTVGDGIIRLHIYSDGKLAYRMNGAAALTAAGTITSNSRYIAMTRALSTHHHFIVDGNYSVAVSANSAAVGVPAGTLKTIVLGGSNINGVFGNGKAIYPAVFFAGLHLTSGEWASFNGAIAIYLEEMGAI